MYVQKIYMYILTNSCDANRKELLSWRGGYFRVGRCPSNPPTWHRHNLNVIHCTMYIYLILGKFGYPPNSVIRHFCIGRKRADNRDYTVVTAMYENCKSAVNMGGFMGEATWGLCPQHTTYHHCMSWTNSWRTSRSDSLGNSSMLMILPWWQAAFRNLRSNTKLERGHGDQGKRKKRED